MKVEQQPSETLTKKFAQSSHPVFRCTSALSRDPLNSEGGGKYSVRFHAELDTAELSLRTITAVEQLSIHGGVAKWCSNQILSETVDSRQEDAKCHQSLRLVLRSTKLGLDLGTRKLVAYT